MGGPLKRRTFAAVLALFLSPTFATAIGMHPMAGCGLGYLILGNSDNSKVRQVLAATTNGTWGNQTFGITSGTSGCTEDGALKLVKEIEIFATLNGMNLRRDIAAGEGEYITVFASMLGAQEAQRPALIAFLHQQYPQLYPAADVSSEELLQRVTQRLAQHPELLNLEA
jgi:hypothetical protein